MMLMLRIRITITININIVVWNPYSTLTAVPRREAKSSVVSYESAEALATGVRQYCRHAHEGSARYCAWETLTEGLLCLRVPGTTN